ncbi:transposase [Micromonospora arborensis]|uniref:IS110 family transposase n=1 Tax=Micromonospora arborensis TaxID=2116518 RepID=UPI0033FCEAF7
MWLSFGLRGPGVAPGRGEAQGFAQLEVALPSRLDNPGGSSIGGRGEWHIRTCGHRNGPAQALRHDRGHDQRQEHRRRRPVRHRPRRLHGDDKVRRQWRQRVWAIEGCQGIGRHLANRLLADGEQVVDVPPKLSARTRVFATGQGRKTDATDAHSIALVGTRMAGLRPVVNDEQLALRRILVDRRRSLGEDHTRMVSQLHQLLLELIPGGAKKSLSAAQAKALLATVRPRDAVGKARRRVAAELIGDLERVYRRSKEADRDAGAETTPVRHRLPKHDQRRHSSHGSGPGRTTGNDNWLQRDRLASPNRLFGEVTSRTRRDPG